jgi:predicted Zn-dependent protease
MHRQILTAAVIAVLAYVAGGCAQNPITGRSQLMMVSDQEAAAESGQAYSQLLNKAEQSRALDTNQATVNRVRGITGRLIEQAVQFRPETRGWAWDVHVLNSSEVNAWCMAGGKMAIYAGLLQKIQPTDDEIAQVMGHEISHALLSHQAEKLSRARAQKLGLGLGVIAGAAMGIDLSGMAGLANTVATVGLQLPNSRENELEADKVGIELAARAGFNPQAAVSLWQKMLNVGGNRPSEWLSTHPNPETRLQTLEVLAQQLMPVYQAARR